MTDHSAPDTPAKTNANGTGEGARLARTKAGHFEKGYSGNPNGRPKGTRNKLSTDLLDALSRDFRRHGEAAIRKVRQQSPDRYLSLIAKLMPKEQHHVIEHGMEQMSDAELQSRLDTLLAKRVIDVTPRHTGQDSGSARSTIDASADTQQPDDDDLPG